MALSPVPQRVPVLGPNGLLTPPWAAFFRDLYDRVGGATGTDAATVASNLSDHVADTVDAHDASAISNVSAGNLAATNVQNALNELQGDVDTLTSSVSAAQSDATQGVSDAAAAQADIDAHVDDTDDAHDASAVSYDNASSGLAATNVQEAIDELNVDISAISGGSTVPSGCVAMWFSSTPPTDWLVLNGNTIGNASSGGTARANADTENLFVHLWDSLDNTALPIQDSSGSPTTRGASAAADFAADKRLPLPNMTGLVPRGTGTQAVNGRNKVGPSLGLSQEDQLQGHSHNVIRGASAVNGAGNYLGIRDTGGVGNISGSLGDATTFGANGTPRTGTETRAASFGVNFIIKM